MENNAVQLHQHKHHMKMFFSLSYISLRGQPKIIQILTYFYFNLKLFYILKVKICFIMYYEHIGSWGLYRGINLMNSHTKPTIVSQNSENKNSKNQIFVIWSACLTNNNLKKNNYFLELHFCFWFQTSFYGKEKSDHLLKYKERHLHFKQIFSLLQQFLLFFFNWVLLILLNCSIAFADAIQSQHNGPQDRLY